MRQILLVCLVSVFFLAACGSGETNLFPDPAMKACVQKYLNWKSDDVGRTLDINNKDDLALLTKMGCENAGITSLEGYQYLINVTDIRSSQNNITSLEPMRGLTKVEVLQMNDNKITDISALASLTNLHSPSLSRNYITSLQSLESLTTLSTVLASENCITDFSSFDIIKQNNPDVAISGGSPEHQRPASECIQKTDNIGVVNSYGRME